MKENTLHIALTSVQMKHEKEFIKMMETGYYANHKKRVQEHTNNFNYPELYIPFKYYVYGNYDIAFISLINNYDFAQKLFIPKYESSDDKKVGIPAFSYQIITGILNESEINRTVLTQELYNKYPFLGICNLKLNNGFLVGNGIVFTNAAAEIINKKIMSLLGVNGKHIILHSFSWFEITLLVYSDKPDLISEVISTLRALKIEDLPLHESIIINSSKFNHFQNSPTEDIINVLSYSDVFSDTQSHFCIQFDYYNNPNNDKNAEPLQLNTEIEWQVKPGHYTMFRKVIDQKLKDLFNLDNISLITGRGDYVIDANSHLFENNLRLQKLLNNEIESEGNEEFGKRLIDHVRHIKTKVYLKNCDLRNDDVIRINHYRTQTSFRNKLTYNIDINEYNCKLKMLKVSKQCRANVLKMFYHYKNGIKDPILSIYFFDFYYFIKKIMKEIDDKCSFLHENSEGQANLLAQDKKNLDELNDVENCELKLAENFKIFEEALHIRMLNSYRYEDISDINLDFNSSIQQLLSMYNTLAHVVGGIFKFSNNNLIVLINDRSTVANVKSINYSIYDLLTPEFIFFTMPKEILNYYHLSDNVEYQEAHSYFKEHFERIVNNRSSENYSEFLEELYSTGIIDVNNLFIELIRFYFSFNLNEETFLYWMWSYAFKNSSAYNISGSIKEEAFISELVRIIFTLKFYNIDTNELDCPLPQLDTFWQKSFYKINTELDFFFKGNRDFIENFKSQILNIIFYFVYDESDQNYRVTENDVSSYLAKLKISQSSPTRKMSRLAQLSAYFDEKAQFNKTDFETVEIRKENLRFIMFSHLRFISINNRSDGKYISFLYRNWETGEVLKKFNDIGATEDVKYFYRIDQTGGVFFPCAKKMTEYFKIRNSLLVKLWDCSMVETNRLIKALQ